MVALQEMILPMLFTLLALSLAELALRRWIRGPSNDMRTAAQDSMMIAVRAHAGRTQASRPTDEGHSLSRISRESRMPHDVVGLAMYMETHRGRVRHAAGAASNAARGN